MEKNKLEFISEIASTHNGNPDVVEKLIIDHLETGANFIKFQILKADNLSQDSSLCGVPIALEKVDSKVWFRVRILNWKRLCKVFVTFPRRFKQWIIGLPFLV